MPERCPIRANDDQSDTIARSCSRSCGPLWSQLVQSTEPEYDLMPAPRDEYEYTEDDCYHDNLHLTAESVRRVGDGSVRAYIQVSDCMDCGDTVQVASWQFDCVQT